MMLQRFASIPGWGPTVRNLDSARRDIERLFDSLTGYGPDRTSGVYPAINVTETGDSLRVTAEIPGIAPDSLDVTYENDTLTIAGKRETFEAGDEVSYHRRERGYGEFRRSLSLPMPIASDGIQARYDNGVLTVDLPKAAEARPRQISIQTGS